MQPFWGTTGEGLFPFDGGTWLWITEHFPLALTSEFAKCFLP